MIMEMLLMMVMMIDQIVGTLDGGSNDHHSDCIIFDDHSLQQSSLQGVIRQ